MRDPRIDVLLRGSRLNGRSSLPLAWDGLTVERRVAPAIERCEETLDCHYMLLWCGHPIAAERDYRPGRFVHVVKSPGTISLGAAGRLAAVRPRSPYDVVACAIDTDAVERIVMECDIRPGIALHQHLGAADIPLAHLIHLLALEAEEGGASGRLYGDSLAHAALSRFITIAQTDFVPPRGDSPLPKHRLRHVLDRIEAEYDQDLSLNDLARESGYSRAHFLRMFRLATGKTPHQYLRDVRLDRARDALTHDGGTLAEIAAAVGFSSHSHLTRLFLKRFNLTPSAFRRIK